MSLEQLATKFSTAFDNSQYQVAGELLPKIKLELAKHGLLVPKRGSNVQDLLRTRDILEKGIFTSIHLRNEAEFPRLISQIHPFFYPSTSGTVLPPSENQFKIMALYLLLLLSKNEIAEFHTELETLATLTDDSDAPYLEDLLEKNEYLRYPVYLERWLMEGSYHKVWKSITDFSLVPAPEFGILAESLRYTVRDEIARSAEVAYESLPIANARHLLYLTSDDELISFAKSQPGWKINTIQKTVTFPSVLAQQESEHSSIIPSTVKGPNPNDLSEEFDPTDDSAPFGNGKQGQSEIVVAQCLDYAREIETII